MGGGGLVRGNPGIPEARPSDASVCSATVGAIVQGREKPDPLLLIES